MKPMIALIATGVILLLIMLYFGNKYFDGVVETNVFTNADNYNKTAPIIIEFEKNISHVTLKRNDGKVELSYQISYDKSKYNNIVLDKVELTIPSKNNTIELEKQPAQSAYITTKKIQNGFYKVIFHITADNTKTFKVIKTTYLE